MNLNTVISRLCSKTGTEHNPTLIVEGSINVELQHEAIGPLPETAYQSLTTDASYMNSGRGTC